MLCIECQLAEHSNVTEAEHPYSIQSQSVRVRYVAKPCFAIIVLGIPHLKMMLVFGHCLPVYIVAITAGQVGLVFGIFLLLARAKLC